MLIFVLDVSLHSVQEQLWRLKYVSLAETRESESQRDAPRTVAHTRFRYLFEITRVFHMVVQIRYLELPYFGNSAHTCLQFTAREKGESIAHFAAVLQSGPALGKPVSTPRSALASTLHRERSQGLPRRQEAAECVGPAECDARGARVASLLGALLSS